MRLLASYTAYVECEGLPVLPKAIQLNSPVNQAATSGQQRQLQLSRSAR